MYQAIGWECIRPQGGNGMQKMLDTLELHVHNAYCDHSESKEQVMVN